MPTIQTMNQSGPCRESPQNMEHSKHLISHCLGNYILGKTSRVAKAFEKKRTQHRTCLQKKNSTKPYNFRKQRTIKYISFLLFFKTILIIFKILIHILLN